MSPKKKSRPAASRKPAAKKKAAPSSGLVFTLDLKKSGLEPALGAAYLMMDRAWVALEGDKVKTLIVALAPKPGVKAADLRADFEAELASQRLRWAVAKANRGVREFVAENAVALAQQKPAAPAAEAAPEQLTDEQRSEIERLIAEVESEIKDMNAKKAVADPKGVSPSWEAQQETQKGGAKE
ncbi:MAG: hypothetical protein SF051_15030 [Elusimicrobiota bacterium]|nr:hypothetical protein [Elusimicrobiota bacterium]